MKNSTYEKLYSRISRDIVSGRLKAGQKLPSIRSLADIEGVSCNTVIAAYNLLLSEGFINSKEKSGYFVAGFEQNDARPIAGDKQEFKSPQDKTAGDSKAVETLNLSANLVDSGLFPYATLRQLYREALSGKNISLLETRGESGGDLELRSTIASFLYANRGINCTPDQVVIGNGTAFHLQRLAMMFKTKPVFFMEYPGFESNNRIVKDMGCTVLDVPLDDNGLDASALRELSANNKNSIQLLHISPSHEFPIGCTMSAPRRQSVLNWACESPSRYVVEDDYDSDFRYVGHPIPALQSLGGNKVIYIGTFSRTLTPSMRISYMILPKDLLNTYSEKFQVYPCPVSRTDQKVVSMFIMQGYYQRHINRMKRIYRQRRDLMLDLLGKQFPEAEVKGQQAGLHFIFKPIKNFSEYDAQKAVKEAAKLGMIISCTSQWLIVGWAHLNEEQMKQAVLILEKSCSRFY